MLRLFVALPIPEEVVEQILPVQRGLKGAKWSPRENLHITLRFIGDVDAHQGQAIDALLADIHLPPFEISLQGSGYFGGRTPHAAWLGVAENPALLALQKKCERVCRQSGLAPDPRSYTPHVTVCYLPRHQLLEAVAQYQFEHSCFVSDVWLADRFYLYSSQTHGPGPSRFTIEAEYPLLV